MRKFTLFLFAFAFALSVNAQIFSKKMPVGVKTYQIQKEKMPLVFLDIEGAYDGYNFNKLDTTQGAEEGVIVLDRKANKWRLPLTLNEAMGISDKEGEEPLQRVFYTLSEVRPALRQKIE